MKQLEVQIMGQSYLLGCPAGGESRLLEAVERVDTAMCRIRDAGKVRARDRIAVLADGRIVAIGPMGEMQRSDHPWVKAYFRGRRATLLEQRNATAPA